MSLRIVQLNRDLVGSIAVGPVILCHYLPPPCEAKGECDMYVSDAVTTVVFPTFAYPSRAARLRSTVQVGGRNRLQSPHTVADPLIIATRLELECVGLVRGKVPPCQWTPGPTPTSDH